MTGQHLCACKSLTLWASTSRCMVSAILFLVPHHQQKFTLLVACRLPWLYRSHICHPLRQGTPAERLLWHNHWAGGHLDAQHRPQAWQGPCGGAAYLTRSACPVGCLLTPLARACLWGLLDAEMRGSAIKRCQGRDTSLPSGISGQDVPDTP